MEENVKDFNPETGEVETKQIHESMDCGTQVPRAGEERVERHTPGERPEEHLFWIPGRQYIVRTVIMIYVATFKKEEREGKDLIFENCAWIPETSEWHKFVKGVEPREMQPYANDMLINRESIVDATPLTEPMEITVKG